MIRDIRGTRNAGEWPPSLCLVRGHGNTEGFGEVTMNQFSVVIFHADSEWGT